MTESFAVKYLKRMNQIHPGIIRSFIRSSFEISEQEVYIMEKGCMYRNRVTNPKLIEIVKHSFKFLYPDDRVKELVEEL